MSNKKSGARTLLWSVLMSSPGPLVVGLGLLSGRSSTQISFYLDFIGSLIVAVYLAWCGIRTIYEALNVK